jgi:hypothetical protein
MKTPYSECSTFEEFAARIKGRTPAQAHEELASERALLQGISALPLRKARQEYPTLAEYEVLLWLFDEYMRTGQMLHHAYQPGRSEFVETVESLRKDWERAGQWPIRPAASGGGVSGAKKAA